MKTPPRPPYTGGTNGPRRPLPVAQWQRTPAAELLRTPYNRDTHRLRVRAFPPSEILPNCPVRNSIVQFAFLLTIGSDYDLQGRVERGDGGPVLAVERYAYDRLLGRWVEFDCPPELQASAYRRAGREFLREQGRGYATGEGRN